MKLTLNKSNKGAILYLTSVALFRERSVFIAFTGRKGGVSGEPYNSLNISYNVGDDPRAVRQNRSLLAGALGIDGGKLTFGKQVHGNEVRPVDPANAGAGAKSYESALDSTDGLITADRGIPIGVQTADCLPVIIVGTEPVKIAVLHCGWRGLTSGIIEKGLKSFNPENCHAFLGPSIRRCCFEVGAQAAGAFGKVIDEDSTCNVSLTGEAVKRLTGAGVPTDSIADTKICTVCDNEDYFSYRAGRGVTGRQTAIAVIR